MVRHRKIVGVMGSGDKLHQDLAEVTGEVIAAGGYHLLTGAGCGVMAAVAKAYTKSERAGLSIGVVRADPSPSLPPPGVVRAWEANAINQWVELPIKTHLPSSSKGLDSRNHINVLTAHALVVLPGGKGTESELELAVEYGRTVILYIGNEKVNNRTVLELEKAYPTIYIASGKSELVDLLTKLVGPACA
jgi:predicted Rossmann-fold nucleotide-binding protein